MNRDKDRNLRYTKLKSIMHALRIREIELQAYFIFYYNSKLFFLIK